jgi:hypothetical protein
MSENAHGKDAEIAKKFLVCMAIPVELLRVPAMPLLPQ